MRRATSDTAWMTDDKGVLLGIALGFDFVAEHEWGTEQLRRIFGVPVTETPLGLKDRLITAVPETFIFDTFTEKPQDRRRKGYEVAILAATSYTYMTRAEFATQIKTHREVELYEWKDQQQQMAAAWSGNDFAIKVRGEENILKLRLIFEAFARRDILFGAGVSINPYTKGRGLTFVIASLVSAEHAAQVATRDLDRRNLLDAAARTGVEQKLKAAKRGYYALSPEWADEAKTSVRFFLNPTEQDKNNYGWFTPEQLLQWTEGKGPIPKSKVAA